MPKKAREEPTQETPKGHERVPTRENVERNLKKLIAPARNEKTPPKRRGLS
jgi:hypothetical protein